MVCSLFTHYSGVLTTSPACGIPENEPDNQYIMPDVRSGPNCVSPDEHQAAHTCPSCQCVFESEEDRQIHECNSPPKRDIPIHCRFCYSQFEDEASLQQHLTERISLTCDKCILQFCYDFILQDHIETHPTCRKCGQSFTHESELYRVCSAFQLDENVLTPYLLSYSIQRTNTHLWCVGTAMVR